MNALHLLVFVALLCAHCIPAYHAKDVYVKYNGTVQLLTAELKERLRGERKDAALEADKEIRFLSPNEYHQQLANGTWVVYFGEETCSHCQRFTPKWLAVQKRLMTMLDGYGLHMAKFECMKPVAREICDSFNFEGYPNILLFKNGKRVEDYLGDTEVNELAAYLEVKRWQLVADNATTAGLFPHSASMNGTNLLLRPDNFDQVREGTPWFVKFFAPWCGHCKAIAPIWEELATKLEGKVAVGSVDCTVDGSICSQNKVKGYPTLLFFRGPEPEVYVGPRTVGAMLNFALSKYYFKVHSTMPHQLRAEIGSLPVSLLIIYKPMVVNSSSLEFLTKAIAPVAQPLSLLLVPDSDFQHSSKTLPSLNLSSLNSSVDVVVAISRHSLKEQLLYPVDALRPLLLEHFDNYKGVSALQEWISTEKRPPVEELDTSNAQLLLNSEAYILLAVVRDVSLASAVEKQLADSANSLSRKKGPPLSGGSLARGLGQGQVAFAWINAHNWSGYLKRVFDYRVESAPPVAVYVFLPSRERFWDAFNQTSSFTLDSSVDALYAVQAGKTAPYKSTETTSRQLGMLVVNFVDSIVGVVYNHAIIVVVLAVIVAIVAFIKVQGAGGSQLPQHSGTRSHWTKRPLSTAPPKTQNVTKIS